MEEDWTSFTNPNHFTNCAECNSVCENRYNEVSLLARNICHSEKNTLSHANKTESLYFKPVSEKCVYEAARVRRKDVIDQDEKAKKSKMCWTLLLQFLPSFFFFFKIGPLHLCQLYGSEIINHRSTVLFKNGALCKKCFYACMEYLKLFLQLSNH